MEAGELMATANIYAYDGHYDNITSTSTGWLDGDNQLYAGKDTPDLFSSSIMRELRNKFLNPAS